jgi:hypothetical protein
MGVLPGVFLKPMEPSVNRILDHMAGVQTSAKNVAAPPAAKPPAAAHHAAADRQARRGM